MSGFFIKTGNRREDAARRRRIPGRQYVGVQIRCSRAAHPVVLFARYTFDGVEGVDLETWTEPFYVPVDEHGKAHLDCPVDGCGQRDMQVRVADVEARLTEMWAPTRRAVVDLRL